MHINSPLPTTVAEDRVAHSHSGSGKSEVSVAHQISDSCSIHKSSRAGAFSVD
jgi:hypothetical protein